MRLSSLFPNLHCLGAAKIIPLFSSACVSYTEDNKNGYPNNTTEMEKEMLNMLRFSRLTTPTSKKKKKKKGCNLNPPPICVKKG